MSAIRCLFLMLLVTAVGCGSGIKEFPVSKVEGTLTCGGSPVPHAFVHFQPMRAGNSATVGKAAFAVADEEGHFVLSTYGTGDGAVIAHHRVRVSYPTGEKLDSFQCNCQIGDGYDQMEVDITEGEDHNIEVILLKPKGPIKKLTRREREDLEDI